MWLPCPYLDADVELTDERSAHILRGHPELFANYRDLLAGTLADPEQVLVDAEYPSTRLFVRWYNELLDGKNIVVAVVSTPAPPRHWIVTAFVTSRQVKGAVEWRKT